MRRIFNAMISLVLAVCILCTATLPSFAQAEEEYLSELRLVYADSYQDAVDSLEDGDFSDYKVLNVNLNKDSGKQAVWLAYKTTTDIEDAITDIAVMQMNGGYREGNYQEMLQQSFDSYIESSEVYLQAVDYFINAYNEGDFLAESAFRQLNFYCDSVDHDGELLGDLFEQGLDAPELAKIFMQGNSYALTNIRSLLAMGVSYNEDGKHYLEHVEDAAALFAEDPTVFEDEEDFEDYDAYAALISATLLTFRNMFEEYETVKGEIDMLDEDVTDTEIKYMESYAMATLMEDVDYLDGETLYEYCLNFVVDEDDLSSMYPLVYALNDGQKAMTRVSHYYNVVRYSVTDMDEELIEEELDKMEEEYGDNPFDVYRGVDMSVFEGTFALTSDAYRQDALTGEGYLDYLIEQQPLFTGIALGTAVVGFNAVLFGAIRAAIVKSTNQSASEAAANAANRTMDILENYTRLKEDLGAIPFGGFDFKGAPIHSGLITTASGEQVTVYSCDEWANIMMAKYFPDIPSPEIMPYANKLDLLDTANMKGTDIYSRHLMHQHINKAYTPAAANQQAAEQAGQQAYESAGGIAGIGKLAASLYIIGGAMMIYSAISLCVARYNQRHPEYSDIPVALVDLVNTVDGDRYIKYDAVLESEFDEDGNYAPGDTNAFAGERWNALYYTKSYEAGQPLLAEIVVSFDNNTPEEGYSPVHRFGEIVSYDLNKYCFSSKAETIYLSARQSENNKSAVDDVPSIVASLISGGLFFLAVGGGAAVGVCATLGVQAAAKKKKAAEAASEGDGAEV